MKYKIKKKILLLGSTGLFGITIYNYLKKNKNFKIYRATNNKLNFRNDNFKILFRRLKKFNDLEILRKRLIQVTKEKKIDFIINCIGYTEHQGKFSNNYKKILNTKLPLMLSEIVSMNENKSKLIHFSTDCVFSGLKVNYNEKDIPDSKTSYGITKRLGEISNNNNLLTFRTSAIGHENKTKKNLLEWFLNNDKKKIFGYKNIFFSGPTTLEIAKIIEKIIKNNSFTSGLFHLSSRRISKYHLLKKIKKQYDKKIEIIPAKVKPSDKSLNSNKFQKKFKYKIKDWNKILKELYLFNKSVNEFKK